MKIKAILLAIIVVLMLPTMVQASKGKNMYYYILVDRFESGEQNEKKVEIDDPTAFHGGDFTGILNRIDHLSTLGVTHVILSPIFEAEDYTGFDVTSYDQIQDTFGTKKELAELIQSLNKNKIEVILHFPIKKDLSKDQLIQQMQRWNSELPISGYYFSNTEAQSTEFWKEVSNNVDGLLIGESLDNPDSLLKSGFDRVVDRSAQDEAVNFFKHFDQPLQPLMKATDLKNEQLIYSMDHYDSDRFTHVFADTGSHPITHWKLALTYLMTTANEPMIYQGSEIPLDGVKEDGSNHQMMNFLAGDDQLIRHIEKISNAYNDLPSLSKGKLEVLHAKNSYLVFKRTYRDETTIVAINNSSSLQKAKIELGTKKELRGLLVDDLIRESEDGVYTVALDRESSNIYMVQESTGIYWPLVLIFGGIMSAFIIFAIVMYRKKEN